MAINRTSSHGEWSSRTAFILAAAGSAVGLGNIWKFPYIAGENGGGAFVLIYIMCVLFIGIPIMLSEVYLGKRGRLNPIASIRYISERENRSKNWQIIGLIGILAGILILSYYSVIAGWTMAYASRTAFGVLNNIDASGAALVFENFISDPERLLAWHTMFSIITAVVVSRGVKSGLENTVIRLMPALLVLLLALVFFSAVEGDFVNGVKYTTSGGTFVPNGIRINTGSVCAGSACNSDWGLAMLVTWDYHLSDTNLEMVSNWLNPLRKASTMSKK